MQIESSSSKIKSLSINEVQRQFEHWRETRSKKGRIPEKLWDAAVNLAETCSINQIAKTLHLSWAVQNRLKNFFGIWSPPSLLAVTAALETLKAGRLQEKRPLDPAFLLGHTILGNNLKRLCFLHFFDGFWNLESSSIRPPDDPKSKIPGCRDSVKPRASV